MMAIREASFIRNAGWMFLGQGCSLVLQATYFILLARLLGKHEFGIFVGATALVSMVSQYGSMGSGMVLLRHVSQKHEKVAELWGNVLVTTCGAGFVLVLLLTMCGAWFIGASSGAIIVFIAIGECVCAKLAEAAGQAFQASYRLQMTAVLTTGTNLMRLAAVTSLVVVLHHTTAKWWAQASLAVSCVSALMAVTVTSLRVAWPRFRPSLLLDTASEGLGFSFASSTTSVYNDLDKAMLSHYGMVTANGVYAMGYKWIDIACVPIRAIHAAAFPRFCQQGVAGARESIAFAKQVLQTTLPYSFVCGVLLLVCSPLVIPLLGDTFQSSVSVVRWLCLLPALRSLHLSAGDTLTGAGYQRYRTGAQLAAAAFNFGINLYFIPAFSWRGAAWSSLLTDALLAATNWAILGGIVKKELANDLPDLRATRQAFSGVL
jgi:O-antigen/teichoic acid export membrane protein